jgi:hypothetical protein
VIGQTGTGKSTLLRNLILQDIDEGRGVGFIDPHGDVAEELLDCILSHRTDHVAYFNPVDLEYSVGLNPLQTTHRDMHHLVVDSIIATLKSIWGDVWDTGRMQYVMHHTLSALLFYDHASLLGVNRLLSDPQFRKKILRRVKDPIVEAFWTREFAPLIKKSRLSGSRPFRTRWGSLRPRHSCGTSWARPRARSAFAEPWMRGASSSPISRRGRSEKRTAGSWAHFSLRSFSKPPCRGEHRGRGTERFSPLH